MLDIKDCIQIGQVVKCHGIEGELVLRPADGFDPDTFDHDFLLLMLDGGLVPFPVETLRPKGAEQTIVKLEFCDTHEAAKRLCGARVYVEQGKALEAEDDDRVQVGMLIGFEACEVEKGHIGNIVAIENLNDTNPLFVIEHDGEEFYVPITDDFIAELNTDEKRVTFDLPEGLLDL